MMYINVKCAFNKVLYNDFFYVNSGYSFTHVHVLQKYKVFLTDEIHRCDFVLI